MTQTPLSTSLPVVNGVAVSRTAVVSVGSIVARGDPRKTLPPGTMLAISVSPAMQQAAHRSRGVSLTSAVLVDDGAALVLLWVRAGKHLAVILADLGDAEMRHYFEDAVSVDAMRISLVTEHDFTVTASLLPAALRAVVVDPTERPRARLPVFAGAAAYAVRLLGDDEFLKSMQVDGRRLKSRSLHLHLGPDADGAWGLVDTNRPRTMH